MRACACRRDGGEGRGVGGGGRGGGRDSVRDAGGDGRHLSLRLTMSSQHHSNITPSLPHPPAPPPPPFPPPPSSLGPFVRLLLLTGKASKKLCTATYWQDEQKLCTSCYFLARPAKVVYCNLLARPAKDCVLSFCPARRVKKKCTVS